MVARMAPWMMLLTATAAVQFFGANAETPSPVKARKKRSSFGEQLRLFGGTNAGEHEFPGQVYILSTQILENGKVTRMFCGGTIISETWIITAAHCLDNNIHTSVMGGSADLNNLEEREVKRTIVHSNYTLYGRNNNNAVNDVGLVELSEPFELDGRTLRALSLPECCEKPEPGGGYVVAGWGRWTYQQRNVMTREDIDHPLWASTQLKKLLVDVVNCPVSYADSNVICTKYSSGTGPCNGDSGGPLVRNGVIYGVTSFVDNIDPSIDLDPNELCDQDGTWTVFMSLSRYRGWIRSFTGL